MLNETDYHEAVRRYRDIRTDCHGRQAYHALILTHQDRSYLEVGRILLVDEETIIKWVRTYDESGLDGLKNDSSEGDDYGQSELTSPVVEETKPDMEEETKRSTEGNSYLANEVARLYVAGCVEIKYLEHEIVASTESSVIKK